MISSRQIAPLRTASADYRATEELKAELAQARGNRHPFYLTTTEFEKILHWKLDRQYGRGKELRRANTAQVIRTVSEAVFSVSHPDPVYLIELRLGLLCSLRGVGVPIASAVLALVYPTEYCVIDFRGWRQVFEQDRNQFSISDYKRYLARVRELSRELQWPVQEVDLAIWECDLRQSKGRI